ncbi:MAG: TonB-dependent receptor domain-containing protein, partial [Vulcanimicrobiaceae bacterium]
MKRVLRAIVALFCLCSFVPSAPALAVDTGQIVGTVINVATNKPVAGAEVIAQSPSGTFRATSDARGQFSIVNVPTDTYAVRVGDNLKLQFQPQIFYGVTVLPGQPYHIAAQLGALRTIATVRGRSATSPFQPNNLRGSYNLGSNEIKQFVGKDFNVSGQQLLATLPGITVDRNGTPLIRGGFNFEEAYEVEGIDYTEPNTSLINRFQNFGNSDLINGVGNVEIIPGGGDATHGNTGTGLISITIKRGTKVPFTNVDFEEGHGGDVSQYAIEDSRWLDPKGAFSNYFSLVHNYTRGQYGPYGTDPGSIGASPITSNPNEDSNNNAHSGYLYTTAFYNPANTTTDDWLDNFVFKFGPNQVRSLQFFIEDQHLLEKLDYGGLANGQNFTGVNVATPFPPGVNFGTNPFASIFGSTSLANKALTSVYPAFPYGVPGQAIPYADSINSPFSAFKLDFRTPTDPNGSLETRFYRTFNSQTEYLAQQGIYSSDNGGIRTGVQLDLSHVFGGGKNVVQAGGKYEFAHPYGTTTDTVNYFPAISGLGSNNGQLQISTTSQLDLIPDFISPQPTLFGTDTNGNTIVTGGTPGCVGNVQSSGPPPVYTPPSETGSAYCGYLSRFFANGKVPSIPAEVEVPTANEQQYGLYLQDTYAPNARLHLLGGLRLDGYNFLLPNDPQNPPALNGLAHQRLFEPHVGASYQLTRSDAVLANYGRTLSIPLPTFLGLDIDRSAYDAFNDIPSYDNSKGPFNPGRTLATQANVCGPGVPQTVRQNGISTTIVQGTQPCASYADELYWLYRNYRFGLQSLFKFPLKGASFTNWDFTYEHQFADGTAFRLTPFTRRGYDVVEQSRTLLGWDPSSEVPILSPLIYSNLGLQEANGFEFYVTRPPRLGGTGFLSHLSYQLSATYVNQIG